VPIGANKSELVQQTVENLYAQLIDAGIETLLDDRDERPGVMFADMDLIGIPYRIVVGDRGLKTGEVEFKHRRDEKATNVAIDDVVQHVRKKLG
jgi:prolyl-tRNA synthetase